MALYPNLYFYYHYIITNVILKHESYIMYQTYKNKQYFGFYTLDEKTSSLHGI